MPLFAVTKRKVTIVTIIKSEGPPPCLLPLQFWLIMCSLGKLEMCHTNWPHVYYMYDTCYVMHVWYTYIMHIFHICISYITCVELHVHVRQIHDYTTCSTNVIHLRHLRYITGGATGYVYKHDQIWGSPPPPPPSLHKKKKWLLMCHFVQFHQKSVLQKIMYPPFYVPIKS